MSAAAQINTTNLLTILGVIAAVWAFIPQVSKLQLRFCMSRLDWAIVGFVFLLIHYLVFAPALVQLGLYFSFGPWCFGFNSDTAVYVLLLMIATYFFWRTRSPKLVRGKVGIFREMIEALILTKRYDELVLHLEPQLPKLIKFSRRTPSPSQLIYHVKRLPIFTLSANGGERSTAMRKQRKKPNLITAWFSNRDKSKIQAREILQSLVISSELTRSLTLNHPYFCLKLLETEESVLNDFTKEFLEAMLEAPGSQLYVELKNNKNLNGAARLAIPQSNRILRFFFEDPTVAVKLGVYQAIGDAVCRRLDEDKALISKLNEPLGSYYDLGRYRCPINSGITLFEIMVHEGIHHGLHDHMWLHYFQHFARSILAQMQQIPEEPSFQEWPTPLHYLLARLFSVAIDWMEQCGRINPPSTSPAIPTPEGFDKLYISKEAAKSIGEMMQSIIPSTTIPVYFKRKLLGLVIASHNNLRGQLGLIGVADELNKATIFGTGMPAKCSYRSALLTHFRELDHRLRDNAVQFEKDLDDALINCP
jgi:hypothetical protein